MQRYGMSLPFDLPLHAHEEVLRELEDLGYTDFWSSESNGTDGFTPLALASTWTQARLGIAIIPAYTRGPGLLAMHAASMEEAAPGRFVLGIGSSSNIIVKNWNAMEFDRPWYRVRDTVRFLRAALRGEKIDHEYDTFTVRGFRLARVPQNPPPILIAALRQGMLRLAGREADGAILNWLSPEDVQTVTPYVHEGGSDKEIVARIFCIPVSDRATALEIGRRAIAAYLNVPVYAKFHEWLGRGDMLHGMWSKWRDGDRKGALEEIPEALVDDLLCIGPPERCRERVMRYVENGVHTPALALLHPGDDGDLRATLRALAPEA